jgi:glutamyl-tRNA(Gln) amidotransferase subunit D
MFPELRDIANIDSRLIDNMWSEDMRFSHMQRIAKEVVKELEKKPKGIIVTLGTDFLAVVSAGVSLMLQNIPVPVILVGAQRSSDRGSSDAAMNLVCASEFITQTNFKGVAICMHETQNDISCLILPACKTRKMHSSRRDAFRPINTEAIARVSYENRKIVWLNDDYKEQKTGNFKPLLEMEDKVGLIKVHPNMMPSQFACFKGYKGLVIEGTGLGQMPTGVPNKEAKIHEKIFEEIKGLIKSGCVVVMTTQCIYGAVNMNVYSKGRDLMDVGIFQAKCLPETALVKLSWLLGNLTKDMKDRKKAQKLIEKEFADEMFYRVEDNAFLI